MSIGLRLRLRLVSQTAHDALLSFSFLGAILSVLDVRTFLFEPESPREQMSRNEV